MANYNSCHGCGNSDKGRQIVRCNGCNRVGCVGLGVFGSGGCFTSTKCSCGSTSRTILGRVV